MYYQRAQWLSVFSLITNTGKNELNLYWQHAESAAFITKDGFIFQHLPVSISRNLSAFGISAVKPFLFLIFSMTSAASFSGIRSQRSRMDYQKALPEAVDRNSWDRPNDSATGTYPVMTANKPLCSNPEIFPRLLLTIRWHSPTNSVGTVINVL